MATPSRSTPRRSRPPVVAQAVLAAALALAPAATTPAMAQQAAGMASVDDKNPNGLTLTFGGNIAPGATGTSAAGDKVFNPAAETYMVGDVLLVGPRAPTPTELTKMQDLIKASQLLIDTKNKQNAAQQKAAANAFAATSILKLLPANGDFTQVNKGRQAVSTGPVSDSNTPAGGGVEKASAKATQNGIGKALNTGGTTASATATVGNAIKAPMAAAFASNIDPSPVAWDSPSTRTATLDLSSVNLTAHTSGIGSSAASTLGLRGDYLNGVTDPTTPVSLASSLFTLNLGLFSFDGTTSAPTADLTFLGFSAANDPGGLGISDNVGGTGLTAVLGDLTSRFTALGGDSYGFTAPFTVTMNVPGTAANTLMYFDEADGAATAVPEPASLALLAAGAVAALARDRARRRAAA